jgi:Uma2 family endonuclease
MAAFWLARRLADVYEPRGCAVFTHNRKLRIAGASYYPDVFVQCGPGADEQYETDAVLVLEVLSPDSRLRDRREKAEAYTRLSSLQAYLVVDPDQPRVEVYRREGAEWVWRVFGPGMKVELDALVLDVDSLYDHIGTRA